MYETFDEYESRLDAMIGTGKLYLKYKDILLEIDRLAQQACALQIIHGHGWGEDSDRNIIDEYEILDAKYNILYLSLSDTRSYLQNSIVDYYKNI